jgi:glycosyltransferase involved in cell wall biosynthesis
MNKPFFSVVIPTHNRAYLLKRAIEKVLSQTFEDFELIIVNDHSTDDTATILASYTDKRLKYLLNDRTKGACGARNSGIFAAQGKWVAFLDDDDEWFPDKLKEQHSTIIKAASDVGMICTDYKIDKGLGRKPVIIKNRPTGWIRDKLLYGYAIGSLSSVAIRKDILKKIDGFDERFPSNQDWDLWIRTAEICQVTNVPKTLVKMHQDLRDDRIGQNSRAKLNGHILLRRKFSHLIDQSARLRHRHESHIFAFALLERERQIIFKCLPWVLFGVFIDTINFARMLRTASILWIRSRKQVRLKTYKRQYR